MKDIVRLLRKEAKTIATMESCTGGGIANAITNVEGASEVFKYGAVTYSNEYKIKMGVNPKIIQKYTVYSMETAEEMSKNIAKFAESSFGVGVTGKINMQDINNPAGEDNKIFVSIYDSDNERFIDFEILAKKTLNREENKDIIIKKIEEKFIEILNY